MFIAHSGLGQTFDLLAVSATFTLVWRHCDAYMNIGNSGEKIVA